MKNELLRHVLASLAYRFNKAIHGTTDSSGHIRLGEGSRTPAEILYHMYQVLTATRIFIREGRMEREFAEPLPWLEEIVRFRREMEMLDELLAEQELAVPYAKKIIQGPLADILTHIGQLAMLARFAGTPIPGEDFSAVPLETGKIGEINQWFLF